MNKDLLRQQAEETIYTAKGHYKAADLRSNLTKLAIWSTLTISVLTLSNYFPSLNRPLATLSLLCSIALLIWNKGEGMNYVAEHHKFGDKYLALHKKARQIYFTPESEDYDDFNSKLERLGKEKSPRIPIAAYILAKWSIEKKNPETNNWYTND